MRACEQYFEVLNGIVKKVQETQLDKIMAAADILKSCVEQDGIIHLFGAGHSHLITEDVFWRASTLANIHTIIEPSVSGVQEISKAGKLETLEGYGQLIVAYHRIQKQDAMICISNSGNKAVTIDVAKRCKEIGIPVIIITNVAYSDYLNSTHSSGMKLKDFGDIVLDNCSIIGDTALHLDGVKEGVASTSTIPSCYLLTSLMAQVVEQLAEDHYHPDIYINGSLSANREDVLEHNKAIEEKYFQRIRNL